MMRTDSHNNPTAFTTDIAKQAGLEQGKDWVTGESFTGGVTAKLLGDPIATTIRVIDKIGFYTQQGTQRWVYIGIPKFVWDELNTKDKTRVVQFMYKHEGGSQMNPLFAKALANG